MIVKCEKCQTAYNLKDDMIRPGGSNLRCSNCKHVFKVFPPKSSDKPQKKDKTIPIPDTTLEMVDLSEEVFARGDAIEPYVELGTIGEGGMGEVLLAKDTRLLRNVALKVLKEEVASKAALSFFLREAQITAQLDHPNIVPLYTVRQMKGHRNVSFVMKLIRGKTLADIIIQARNEYEKNSKTELEYETMLRTRLEYFLKACEGIIYAHRKGVVHRDLKPSNIMVGDYGEVYVMDWGIAKVVRDDVEPVIDAVPQKSDMYSGKTQFGTVVGTPGYMSPEQAKGLPEVGVESDQFSLGVILYELITLKPARPGNMSKKLKWAEEGALNQIIHIIPTMKIAPELKAIICKATTVSPKERYSNVAALADDLRCFLRGDEVSQMPDTRAKKVWRWMNKHRYTTLIVVLSVLLLSSAITIGSLIQQRAREKAAQIREKKLTHLLSEVATHTHSIDSHFMRFEGLLANLANQTMYLYQDAPENTEKYYKMSDFQHPEKAPPDLASSSLYRKPVSIEYPVVKLAPGVRIGEVQPVLQKLAPLRYNFKKMLLDSRGTYAPASKEEIIRLLTFHGLPISWAYIGLKNGVMLSYPGKGSFPENYDPRTTPWYKLGSDGKAVYWGTPYPDESVGRVLPCATSLYGKDGQFLGVAAMDVRLDNIIQDNLNRPKAVGVIESFLLDEKGRIIVGSGQLGIKAEASSVEERNFPVKEVVNEIRRNVSGLVEGECNNRSCLVLFQKIRSLGWYYAEEVDTAKILESGEE